MTVDILFQLSINQLLAEVSARTGLHAENSHLCTMGRSIHWRDDADLLFGVTVYKATPARSTVRLTVGDGCAGFERDESGRVSGRHRAGAVDANSGP